MIVIISPSRTWATTALTQLDDFTAAIGASNQTITSIEITTRARMFGQVTGRCNPLADALVSLLGRPPHELRGPICIAGDRYGKIVSLDQIQLAAFDSLLRVVNRQPGMVARHHQAAQLLTALT